MNYSASEENYIKSIYRLKGEHQLVTTNELAAELQTRAASVTDMLKKLKAKKLVIYERYHGFKLSTEGKKVALGIIRRHRLWEYFLSVKLQFSWDEVHEVAEVLEHVTSRKLIDKLDEFLGFPRFDPHGDPIPDQHGKIHAAKQVVLSEWPLLEIAEVSGVTDQRPDMLDILKHQQITIGTQLEIKKKFSFDKSFEIKTMNNPPFIISEQVAKNIWVKKAGIGKISKKEPAEDK
jgi:DtxR family transcriptional regulator, Mn-dependent transcriptional regulator